MSVEWRLKEWTTKRRLDTTARDRLRVGWCGVELGEVTRCKVGGKNYRSAGMREKEVVPDAIGIWVFILISSN